MVADFSAEAHTMRIPHFFAAVVTASIMASPALAQPVYNIVDLGVIPGDSSSQGVAISPNGTFATGRSITGSFTATHAFSWTQGGGIVSLPNTSGHNFGLGSGVNNAGVVVGTGSTTSFGSAQLPLIWQGGNVAQLPLPTGQTLGHAYGINNSNVVVGSANSGSAERAAIYQSGVGSFITTTTSTGCVMTTAYGINDAGLVIGQGIDPNNAARNVGFLYDSVTNVASEVGALSGLNGALCFGVSNAGQVVGSTMLNQGSGTPFIWTVGGGMLPIPLATGTSQGSAKGVNSNGWVVGTDSSAFAIPFLYDGTNTYRIGDLIPSGTGWDLLANTSSSALSISDNGIIVGTGVLNGNVHGYALVPVPEPGSFALVALGLASFCRRRLGRLMGGTP
jgi:hypothetical protein